MARYFYERFRAELVHYREGVHQLGDPAPAAALGDVPEPLAQFLLSFNGARLFVDAYEVFDVDRLERDDAWLIFGRAGDDRLALDLFSTHRDPAEPGREPARLRHGRQEATPDAAPVVRLEAGSQEVLVEGTSFALWIEAVIVADGVLYDREGDFRDDLFDETGEELLPHVVVKREKKALKIDPAAPAPAWRLARALERQGQVRLALDTLERLAASAPTFAWAHFDRARLLERADRLADAEAAFARAAESERDRETSAFFWAHAARVAAARDDDGQRQAHARRALALDARLLAGQTRACETELLVKSPSGARAALTLLKALAPRDLGVLDLAQKVAALPDDPL